MPLVNLLVFTSPLVCTGDPADHRAVNGQILLLSWQLLRLRNAIKSSVFEPSNLVSTKTLVLEHYYRRQGQEFPRKCSESAFGHLALTAPESASRSALGCFGIECTPRGSCDNTLLRRVLRRFSRVLRRRFWEAPPPPNSISLIKSLRDSQKFPQVTSKTAFRGSSRVFAFRYFPSPLSIAQSVASSWKLRNRFDHSVCWRAW